MAFSILTVINIALTVYLIPISVPAVLPNAVASFFGVEALDILGARMFVQPDTLKAAQAVDDDMARKRAALGWV